MIAQKAKGGNLVNFFKKLNVDFGLGAKLNFLSSSISSTAKIHPSRLHGTLTLRLDLLSTWISRSLLTKMARFKRIFTSSPMPRTTTFLLRHLILNTLKETFLTLSHIVLSEIAVKGNGWKDTL